LVLEVNETLQHIFLLIVDASDPKSNEDRSVFWLARKSFCALIKISSASGSMRFVKYLRARLKFDRKDARKRTCLRISSGPTSPVRGFGGTLEMRACSELVAKIKKIG
jgi:hypothetical protein